MHSSRTERMNRSACGLQLGLRGGILAAKMPSPAKTASQAVVNFASRSRVRWVKPAARSPSCQSSRRACWVVQAAVYARRAIGP